jgi:hypothetical protein
MNVFREHGLPREAVNKKIMPWVVAVAAVAVISLALPGAAGAAVLAPWGSSLSASPTLDTANGASSQTNDQPSGQFNNDDRDRAISTGTTPPCPYLWGNDPWTDCQPWVHDGADNTEWNTAVAGGTPTAAQGGQIIGIRVKGCAVKEQSAPSQESEGKPVNYVEFDTMTPQGGSFQVHYGPASGFVLPFCGDDVATTNNSVQSTTARTVTSDSITTFLPLHLCVAPGEVPAFYDIGGFIPYDRIHGNGQSWYPQGVPFRIMAPVTGSSMASFADANIAPTSSGSLVFAPGGRPTRPDGTNNNTGWGQEPNQEVLLQVIESTGDDAYGLCPGGQGVEPTNSNQVMCVNHVTNTGDSYGTCNVHNQPVRPPQNQSAPTISVSSNGTAVSGAPVPGNRTDATPGSWTQDPNQSFLSYAYQWEDCDSSGASCTPIGGQVGKNPYYYATNNDVGHTIDVAVSASNNANTGGPANSAPTSVVGGPNVPVITTLKLNPSTWNESKFSVITYYDTQAATTTIQILQNGVVVRTITNTDRAKQYGGNGVNLIGLKAGSYQLRLTSNNKGTAGQTLTLSFTITSATPLITKLKVNPSPFNSAKGATVTYTDSQSGSAVLSVLQCPSKKQKAKKGNNGKKGKTHHTTQQNGCSNAKVLKTLHHQDRAGRNGVKLTGLAPGRYQLQIVSTYAGRKSTAVLTPFAAKLVHTRRQHTRRGVRHAAADVGAAVASVFG